MQRFGHSKIHQKTFFFFHLIIDLIVDSKNEAFLYIAITFSQQSITFLDHNTRQSIATLSDNTVPYCFSVQWKDIKTISIKELIESLERVPMFSVG